MVIYQGDQYNIPFLIRHNGEVVTPDKVSDVVIGLGELVRSYRDGTLSYFDGKFMFPIHKKETLIMQENISYQVQLVIGEDIIHSREYPIKRKTIIDSLKRRLHND